MKNLFKKTAFFYPILLGLLCVNCNNKAEDKKRPKQPLDTPQAVCQQWQYHLDNNEIEAAIRLSTPATKEWLEENKLLFLSDNQIYLTQFLKMNCDLEEDKAICHFTIREEGEIIDDYYILKRINGQWLVDLEEDTSMPALDQQIFEEMEKALNLDK